MYNDYYTLIRQKSSHFQNLLHLNSYSDFCNLDKSYIRMYGRFLGVDITKTPTFFKTVVSAISEPCPSRWSENIDINGVIYYQNNLDNTICRHHPMDDYYRTVLKQNKGKTPCCILL